MKLLLIICSLFFGNNLIAQQTQCGDLLVLYATKPHQAIFEKCKQGEGQIRCTATYKVKASDVDTVERFLIKHYKMGKLKFVCCGWESSKDGNFKNCKIDLGIEMYANAEKTDSTSKTYIEKDRSKVDYFYIVVTLFNEI